MATHLEVGKEGEKLAEAWLAQQGYTITHRNWRYKQFEIDLIGTKNGKLRFIEVKLRKSNHYGYPEFAVTKKKYKDLQQAINQFLFLNKQYRDFRLDVLAITQHSAEEVAYFLIEDVVM
jgi:putative endonuclease